jgi:predicted component of viral defense system (DUF524 family)
VLLIHTSKIIGVTTREGAEYQVLKQKSRTLCYFVPCNEYFMIAFVLGEKAERIAEQSSIPEHIKKIIASATSYVEGKSFFVNVEDEKDLEPVFTLLKIKQES